MKTLEIYSNEENLIKKVIDYDTVFEVYISKDTEKEIVIVTPSENIIVKYDSKFEAVFAFSSFVTALKNKVEEFTFYFPIPF